MQKYENRKYMDNEGTSIENIYAGSRIEKKTSLSIYFLFSYFCNYFLFYIWYKLDTVIIIILHTWCIKSRSKLHIPCYTCIHILI